MSDKKKNTSQTGTEKQGQRDKRATGDRKMMIPIRCWSCGKPIAHLWEEFQEKSKKENPQKVLDELGLKRYCCRQMLIGHIDLIESAAAFKRA